MEAKKEKDQRYDVIIAKIGGGAVCAYKPNGTGFVSVGDEVEIENQARGTVLSVDTYNRFEELVDMEKKTGMEFVKIAAILSRNEIEWEE